MPKVVSLPSSPPCHLGFAPPAGTAIWVWPFHQHCDLRLPPSLPKRNPPPPLGRHDLGTGLLYSPDLSFAPPASLPLFVPVGVRQFGPLHLGVCRSWSPPPWCH
ncbi:hypothetical protein TIFTF001_009857 [Ficus carica]|uniref:Uncharacterized protein n=1 Tax=Ficus carica TaxID=3494 RepID=A0AA88A7M0_FICCA|nr:hypothetical protein TIFTF001_009857 [Ficus carica]